MLLADQHVQESFERQVSGPQMLGEPEHAGTGAHEKKRGSM